MELREDILNELREISPVVANMPYLNVYTVDPGYFSGIEAELLARIAVDRFADINSFTVPEGYFDGLAGSILQKIKAAENDSAAEEIKSLSPALANIGNENLYNVPKGYFDGLAGSILQKIKTAENVSVAEEIKSLSPALAYIGNENVYTVPQGYFEELTFAGAEKAPAKVIKMNPVRSVFKYAAAAVITGLLGISVINIVDRQRATHEKEIAFVSPETMNTANTILKNGTFDKELNNLSDKEIEQYLKESGQDVNAALVASSANDESTLPDATDYLIDENTLDNYLKDNNLKN